MATAALIVVTLGGGIAALATHEERPPGAATPEAALRGYYRGLAAGDCEATARFVDPSEIPPEQICDRFDEILELSGELLRVVERAEEGDRATLIFERTVQGVTDRRISRVRRTGSGWLLAGGSSCYPEERPPDLGGDHLARGEGFDEYSSNPPTSGPHAPQPVEAGRIYREAQPVAGLVHSMEHGAVVFWVGPVEPAFRERVEAIVESIGQQGYPSLILTPYAGMSAPLAMTAWGTLQRCIGVDPIEIGQFVERYYASGLEGRMACEGAALTIPACRP
jgi:hypothetical protein